MKQLFVASFVLLVLVQLIDTPKVVSTAEAAPVPEKVVVLTEPNPTVSARAYGVFDVESGELLFSHNADVSLPIASITKLFTAAAVLESGRDTDRLVITATDVATEGRAGKLAVGQEYHLHELLFPLLLESSNDAAVAIARYTTPHSVTGVVLDDTSGLSPDNRATVEGLAMAVRSLYQSEPHIFDITRLPQMVGVYTGWVNNSPVLNLPGYRGGKHGYTEAASHTLTAFFSEPSLGGRELEYVILGSDDVRADTVVLRQAVKDSVELQ